MEYRPGLDVRLVDPGLNVSLDGATVSFHRVDGIVQIVIVVFLFGFRYGHRSTNSLSKLNHIQMGSFSRVR